MGKSSEFKFGFGSDRLAALCVKYGSRLCWKIAKQWMADCSYQWGSPSPFLCPRVPGHSAGSASLFIYAVNSYKTMHEIKRTSLNLDSSDTSFLFGCSKYSNHSKHEFHLLYVALKGLKLPPWMHVFLSWTDLWVTGEVDRPRTCH